MSDFSKNGDTPNIGVKEPKSVFGPGFNRTFRRFQLRINGLGEGFKKTRGLLFVYSRTECCFEPENKRVCGTTCGRSRRGALGQRPKKPIGSAAYTL